MATSKTTRVRWTQEDDTVLTALVNKGQCAKEIGKILNRTTQAVTTRKWNLGLHDIRIKPATGALREARTSLGAVVKVENPFSAMVEIPGNLVRSFIGAKGAHITSVQELFGVKVRVDDNDMAVIRGNSQEAVEACETHIQNLVREPQIGETYTGEVNMIVSYGAFISLNPLYQGLCHASEITGAPIDNVRSHLSVGQEVRVKVIAKVNGKCSLSIAAAQPLPEVVDAESDSEVSVAQVMSPREITAEMTRLARQLARTNGQRMVMAIYYVEGEAKS